MPDDKVRVSLEIKRELLTDLHRIGLTEHDIVAVCTCKFDDDAHAARIADLIERDGRPPN
jgi:hypothetical protein